MNQSGSLITRIWRKLQGKPALPKDATTPASSLSMLDNEGHVVRPKAKRQVGGIESLEGRIAPASLLNPSTIVYTDKDGDLVTIKFSKNLFTGTGTVLTDQLNSVFKFSAGSVFATAADDPGIPQELQLIDLTKIPTVGIGTAAKSPAAGVSITVTAVKADTLKPGATEGSVVPGTDGILDGDGLANVGVINATSALNSFGLGKVTIDGDLGQIDCGESKTAVGLKSLTVNSLGAATGTQPTGTGFPNVESKITGTLGSLTVLTDIKNAYVHVVNGSGFSGVKAVGKIGSIDIGHALIGNTPNAASSDNTGVIQTDSSIGSIKIGSGGASDGILGGGGRNSGSIIAAGKIGSILIDGSLVGHDGANSGSILGNGGIGSVKVTGDLKIAAGATQGGAGLSASIEGGGDIGKVTIDGSIIAGAGEGSGTIFTSGKMGAVKIGGSVIGKGAKTGGIYAAGNLTSVSIGGDLIGGASFFSGYIQSDENLGTVKIGGDLKIGAGTTGERNGVIVAGGSIKSVEIGGGMIGGAGISSASIYAGVSGEGGLGSLTIGKAIIGGTGENSGAVVSEGKIGKIVVNGDNGVALQGGANRFSGTIFSYSGIGSLTLHGNVIGGDGNGSGSIQSTGLLEKLTIDGDLKGGLGIGSGAIVALDDFDRNLAGDVGKISITGKLIAGRGADSGSIHTDGNVKSINLGAMEVPTFETGSAGAGSSEISTGLGSFHRGDVGSITVTGKIDGLAASHSLLEIRGSLESLTSVGGIANGVIHVADRIGSIETGKTGRQSVSGNVENVLITAGSIAPSSAKQALSIAKITVNGDVTNSQILAGYDLNSVGTNGDAQIGAVKVSGNWNASDLIAGVLAVNGEFGDSDDSAITGGNDALVSRIASLVINGTVTGTDASDTDHFGFVAQQIGSVKINGSSTPGLPADVAIHELLPT